MRTCSLAVVAVAALAGGATAGPIHWSYAPTFIGDRDHYLLNVGEGTRPDFQSPDGWRHYTGYTVLMPFLPPGPHLGGVGSTSVQVGTTAFPSLVWRDDPYSSVSLADLDGHFRAAVTITDDQSGRTGTFGTTGWGRSSDAWLGMAPWLTLDDTGPAEQLIGGNRYRVRFRVEQEYRPSPEGPTLGRVFADVETLPATPEPATLVLAGLGIAGVGAVRLRRRN